MDVEVFEAEIKNEILITRGQSHVATKGYFFKYNCEFLSGSLQHGC